MVQLRTDAGRRGGTLVLQRQPDGRSGGGCEPPVLACALAFRYYYGCRGNFLQQGGAR